MRAVAREGDAEIETKGMTYAMGEHWHNYQDWLHEKRRDAQGRPIGHPAFDPSTLKLPSMDKRNNKLWGGSGNGLTHASKQWWKIKAQYADCVLFFKVGKFYELFHMDADIGVKYLSSAEAGGKPFIYMKGMRGRTLGSPRSHTASFPKFSLIMGSKLRESSKSKRLIAWKRDKKSFAEM